MVNVKTGWSGFGGTCWNFGSELSLLFDLGHKAIDWLALHEIGRFVFYGREKIKRLEHVVKVALILFVLGLIIVDKTFPISDGFFGYFCL